MESGNGFDVFTYLRALLVEFHSKPMVSLLTYAVAVLLAAVVLVSFLHWLRRRNAQRPEHWTGLITLSTGNVLKVLAGIGVVVLLCLYLRFQSGEFARLRGGRSERNQAAVQMIWGRPHTQRELTARLFTKKTHYYDKDGLEFDPKKLLASDKLIAFNKREIETTLSGNWIQSSDHTIDLKMNYRKKGNATYPGFEVDCRFGYVVENGSETDAKGSFYFPMPQQQGLVDHFSLSIDGQEMTHNAKVTADGASWNMPMPKGRRATVAVSYHSRGLGHIRILPGQGRKHASYSLAMRCRGVDGEAINYPVGCMTPTSKTQKGGDLLLAWTLDKAVTRFGMGVILPEQEGKGKDISVVLGEAPWALLLLLGVVLVTHGVLGRAIPYPLLLILAVAYTLFTLLMAHISDYHAGFTGGLWIAGSVLTILTGLLWWRRTSPFLAGTTVGFFALFSFAWPTLNVQKEADLYRSILYVVLLAYVSALLIFKKKLTRNASPSEGKPAMDV